MATCLSTDLHQSVIYLYFAYGKIHIYLHSLIFRNYLGPLNTSLLALQHRCPVKSTKSEIFAEGAHKKKQPDGQCHLHLVTSERY
jgi:hypothetical protein